VVKDTAVAKFGVTRNKGHPKVVGVKLEGFDVF